MIHLNIGSNLSSFFGSRYDNIAIAINLLIESKLKISKISNFYETPSYPNRKLPKFLNIGILANYSENHFDLLKKINLIEKKIGRKKTKKNEARIIDIDIIDFNGKIRNKNFEPIFKGISKVEYKDVSGFVKSNNLKYPLEKGLKLI